MRMQQQKSQRLSKSLSRSKSESTSLDCQSFSDWFACFKAEASHHQNFVCMLITLINKLFVGRWVIYIVDVDVQVQSRRLHTTNEPDDVDSFIVFTSVFKIPCGAHFSSSCMFVVCRGLIGWG